MAHKIATGRIISVEADDQPVENIKSIKWDEVENVTPQLLPDQKEPVGWLVGHTWVEGELQVFSADYVFEQNEIIDDVEIVAADIHGGTETFNLFSFIISSRQKGFTNEGESVTIYKFKAGLAS